MFILSLESYTQMKRDFLEGQIFIPLRRWHASFLSGLEFANGRKTKRRKHQAITGLWCP